MQHRRVRPAARIAVEVRFAPFIAQTRGRVYDADVIEQVGLVTLDRLEHTRPVHLLGV
jgi:DNA polymerase IV